MEVKVKGGPGKNKPNKVAQSCFHRSIGIDESILILDSRKIALGYSNHSIASSAAALRQGEGERHVSRYP